VNDGPDPLSPLLLASARFDNHVVGRLAERLDALGEIAAGRDHAGAAAAREVLLTIVERDGLHEDERAAELLRSLGLEREPERDPADD